MGLLLTAREIVVPFGRSPYVLARTLAQLDQVSGGRLLLSFVTGLGQPGERAALQIGDANRGAVLEEVLELVRAFWSGEGGDGADPAGLSAAALAAAHPVQDPLEVWLGGRGPRALDRVGRIADGWLGALLTADEARVARERIQASAARAGRQIDPEHFGVSIGYARTAPDPLTLRNLAARRLDVDPHALLPVGKDGLRGHLAALIEAGLSKFVVRPTEPRESPEAEVSWLAEAILDLQS
jgi:alkanesulfonate monooxygenase SsuD/methylene tetrahydromethanopterin reductase-like flavin-dependent oxidoreductase (luciferase family)